MFRRKLREKMHVVVDQSGYLKIARRTSVGRRLMAVGSTSPRNPIILGTAKTQGTDLLRLNLLLK